jgi:hypothetical protein
VRGADAVERDSELKRKKWIRLAGVRHSLKPSRCAKGVTKRLPWREHGF